MTDELKFAAYSAMVSSWAWNDFIQWCSDRVNEAELKAAALSPADKEHFESYFRAWQERKKFHASLLAYIEEVKQLKEQQSDERPSQHTYGDPTGGFSSAGTDTTFPGY